MGVIKRGILGGFSGKVGNIVGSSWKGIATMKALPLSVANPNTAGQVIQRGKMSNIVAFIKPILNAIVKPLNDRFASGMSGYNLFVQRNIALFTTVAPTAPEDLVIASGNVSTAAAFSGNIDVSDNELSLNWNNNSGTGNALATDIMFAFFYNRNLDQLVLFAADKARNSSGFSDSLPAGWLAGHVVDIWGAFRRADGSQVSDTMYDEATVAA